MPERDYTVSSGNVFADLGLPNPEEALAKAELANKISVLIQERKLTQATRKFEGADHAVVTMENDKILVEVVPELEGRVSRYVDKMPAAGR